MKNKKWLSFILLLVFCVMHLNSTAQGRYIPRSQQGLQNSKKDFVGAIQHYKAIRDNQETNEVSYEDYLNAKRDVEMLQTSKSSTLTWGNIGPVNIAGRVRALIIDRNNYNTLYAGAVSGGLWRSLNAGQSWELVTPPHESHIVSCIAQAPDGIIYYGTGENFAPSFGSTEGSTGFLGNGVYKSTNPSGNEFVHILSTNPSTNAAWKYVYEIEVHPNGTIWAATNSGIRISSDTGATWTNPLTTGNAVAHDISISKDGNIIAVVVSNKVYISRDGGPFENESTGGVTGLPASGLARVELDIAPGDKSYIYAYAVGTNQQLKNIYRSTDYGNTWEVIGPGGSPAFNPPSTQGGFNCVIRVHPANKNKIFVGGVDLWGWQEGGNWEQKSLWDLMYSDPFDPYYLHADHHEYIFHPENPNIMYFATDGGIFKSTDGGNTFFSANRNFASVQYYAISTNRTGEIMGGTQDNGTLLMDRKGYPEGRADDILGGDGGYSAFSFIDNSALYATMYYGELQRTTNRDYDNFVPFYSDITQPIGDYGNASFVTPVTLHEKLNDPLSPDSVNFIATENYVAGDTVTVFSKNAGYQFPYILENNLSEDDTLVVQDIVTAKIYLGLTGAVWMTRHAHKYDITPDWYKIATISGTVQTMEISKCGNYLFVGTTYPTGNVYRISNLKFANSSESADVSSPYSVIEVKKLTIPSSGRAVNNIAIDPQNPNRVIVVLGNYGNTHYVYMSTNALAENPAFTSKQGNLPRMPVYSAVIEMNNLNTVILGTEFGIAMTTNIAVASPQWVTDNSDGLGRVPVHDLVQQVYDYTSVTNPGVIYAGTHGRGAFECFKYYVSVPEYNYLKDDIATLNIYPNPTSDVITIEVPDIKNDAKITVYDIHSRIVIEKTVNASSRLTIDLDVTGLRNGVYAVELFDKQDRYSARFLKID